MHFFFFSPKILEIAGPGGRKGAGLCLLTEPEGRARDAAGAADGSGLRLGTSFRPGRRATPARGERARASGGGERPALPPPFLPSPAVSRGPGHREGVRGWSRAEAASDLLG